MRTISSFQTADNRFKNTTIKVCVWIQGLGYFNKLCKEIKIKGGEISFWSGVNVFVPELTLTLSLIFYLYIALNLDQSKPKCDELVQDFSLSLVVLNRFLQHIAVSKLLLQIQISNIFQKNTILRNRFV